MDPVSVLLSLAIASVFIVPAVRWPSLGRGLVALMFLGGAAFNLFYTLPNAPSSLEALVATSFVPLYRDVIALAVSWNGAAFTALVVAIEVAVGVSILTRGRARVLGLLAAATWSLGMLPVIPPDGILIGFAVTGAPGVAALILTRHTLTGSAREESRGAKRNGPLAGLRTHQRAVGRPAVTV